MRTATLRLVGASEPLMRVNVRVTFLRMEQRPRLPGRPLPADAAVARVVAPTVGFYRYLYNTVGAAHLWWLRRVTPDAEIAALLAAPAVSLHVLYRNGAPAGFYELDRRGRPDINLSYFGLLPHAMGQGLGGPLLRHAVDLAWSEDTRAMTVNTCTADSPRALPGYLRMGFVAFREVRETWNIPCRLGLAVPAHLKG